MLMKNSDQGQFFRADEIDGQFQPGSWQRKIYAELDAALTSEARPFPCIYGVAGHQAGQLRYAFEERMTPARVGAALEAYLLKARSFGPNTSLVYFEAPAPIETIEAYHRRFWTLLREMARLDRQPWPEEIPAETGASLWEFCFAGEPVFVVCTTPAHINRQSRRSSAFMLTFQPRWVFDRILGTDRAAARSFAVVRARLERYDFLAPSPALGKYGAEGVREAEQYFLDDRDAALGCPFHTLKD
jgi:Uncharacterized conserved protein